MAQTRRFGDPYSDKNPIPKITTGLKALVSPQKATEAKAQQMQQDAEQVEDKQSQDNDEKRADDMHKGKRILVRDPTTGSDVYVRNGTDEVTEGENVLKLPLPEPDWDEHRSEVLAVATQALKTLAIVYVVSITSIFILPLPRWILYPLAIVPPILTTATLFNKVRNTAKDDADARIWYSERVRGLRAGRDVDQDGDVETEERMRESAEWANSLLAGVWPIMNPSLFDSLVDMLEDIMQGSMPAFVHSVRVADLGLGKVPLRITSIRALPDSSNEQALDKLDADDREQLTGDHINLEVSFAYRAVPSSTSKSSKAQNIHLVIDFFTGLRGVLGFKMPVWVEVKGIVGTARVRLQLIPDPPFIKTTLFTFLGLPHIKPSVVAMSRAMPNIMNLPVVSGFVSSALDTAAAEYVAPKSLILDVQRLLGGSDMPMDTQALGVFIIHIHRATGLKAMDNNGKSDAYVTLAFSHLGKALFSTRIVKEDLNPVFEETAAFPIDLNVIKLGEKLSIQLWDSDRSSADDMMGFVEVDILEFVRNKNTAHRRIAHFSSPDSRDRPGTVEFTIGYFAKLPPNPKARKGGDADKPGRDPGLPEDLDINDPQAAAQDSSAIGDIEKAVLRCPPDDEWVSGILHVQVHEIRDLGLGRGGRAGEQANGIKDKAKEAVGVIQEGIKGSDAQGEDEEAEDLPSSYCTISLNDELVYKTRVKPITSSPIFNAGTEKFVKDWRTAHVGVKIMDSRMRENDAVIGIVYLRLSDLLVNASQITRVYHLEHGLGYGRVRISILFRPVAAKLPPTLRGFDTCMLRVRSVRVKEVDVPGLDKCELRIKATTSVAEDKVSRRPRGEGQELVWEDDVTELPVRQRNAAALILAFKSTGMHRGKSAMSVLWLHDVADAARGVLALPLWTERDGGFARLKQNYVPMSGDLSGWDSDREKLTRVGTLEVDLEIVPGVSPRHRGRLGTNGSKGQLGEEIARMERGHARENIGQLPKHRTSESVSEASDKTAYHSPMGPVTESSPTKTQPDSTAATAGHGRPESMLSSLMDSSPAETQPDSTAATMGHGPVRWESSRSMVASPAVLSQESLSEPRSGRGTGSGTRSTYASTRATAGHGSVGSPPRRPTIPDQSSSMYGVTGHSDVEDGTHADGVADGDAGNTLVPSTEAEMQQASAERTPSASSDDWVRDEHEFEQDRDADEGEEGEQGSDGSESKNPLKKIKAWKQHQRELAADHRGIMQAKPARSAAWMKDKVEHGVHSVKDRFAMEARQPDVETEV